MKNSTIIKIARILLLVIFILAGFWLILSLVFNVVSTRSPAGLAVDRQGFVYVGDGINVQVRKFTAEGEEKKLFGESRAPFVVGPLLRTITVDGRGNVYLAVYDRKDEIRKYDSQGKLLQSWDVAGDAWRLAADRVGNVYIKYADAALMQKFDSNGKLLKEWKAPHDLAKKDISNIFIDEQDNLYTADYKQKTLYKFDLEGNLRATIGGIDNLGYRLVVDSSGYVYVTDDTSRIQKWDWNGKLVKSWGGIGNQPGQFDFKDGYGAIYNLALDTQGHLFTLHQSNGQLVVQQYDTEGRFIRRWTDGYPNGSMYLIQALIFLVILFIGSVGGKVWTIFQPAKFLQPVALPEQVLAAGHVPELLTDGLLPAEKYENAPKQSPKSQLSKPRIYLEQALGTFEPVKEQSTLRIKNVFGFNNPNWLMMQVVMQLWFPATMFFVMNNSRVVWGSWVVAGLTVLGSLSIFTTIVVITNVRSKARANLPHLTKKDIGQLLVVNIAIACIFILLCCLIELIFNVLTADDKSPYTSSSILLLAMGAVGIVAFALCTEIIKRYWLYAPYNEGKYEQTIRRSGFMRRLFDNAKLWALEAEAYRRSGKLDEAEKVYYEAMTHTAHQQAAAAVLLLEGLALVRMEQGRYAESLYLLEKAYDLNKERNAPLVYAAENYARARVNFDRAWQLLSLAQAKSVTEKPFERANRLSIEALLLGYGGDFANAQIALEKSLASADYKFKPGVAELHLRAALIADMQGNDAVALEHYRQVQLNDPFGVNGARASRILRASPRLEAANV